MVAFDATILLPLLSPISGVPTDSNGQPIDSWKERIDHLVEHLENNHEKIIIPTPVLSEVLVHADRVGPDYLTRLKQSAAFKIEPFDDRAAVEVAIMIREDTRAGDKRGGVQATWAKVKFDRQIVAIAKVNGASVIYSDDEGVRTFGVKAGLTVIGISQLPLPKKETQLSMFDQSKEIEAATKPTESEKL